MKCPYCNSTVTAEAVNEAEAVTPSPGDFAFCAGCDTLLIATSDSVFRWATKLDVNELGDDERQELLDVVGTIRFE